MYGIAASGTPLPDGLTGVADSDLVLLESGDLALLASPLAEDVTLETRENLLAHARVLDTVALGAAVLPMRFGTVVEDSEDALREILDERRDDLGDLLAELQGTVQFTLTASYVEETIVGEVTAENETIRELAEATRGRPAEEQREERIRLGELVVGALAEKRVVDADDLLAELEPHVVGAVSREPGAPEVVLDVALLVDGSERDRLENAVEEAARRRAERIRLRLDGPRAPYDFVPEG